MIETLPWTHQNRGEEPVNPRRSRRRRVVQLTDEVYALAASGALLRNTPEPIPVSLRLAALLNRRLKGRHLAGSDGTNSPNK